MYNIWKYDGWYRQWKFILSSPSLSKARQVERAWKKIDPRAYLQIFYKQYNHPVNYKVGFEYISNGRPREYVWGYTYNPLDASGIKDGLYRIINRKYRPLFVKDISRGNEYVARMY